MYANIIGVLIIQDGKLWKQENITDLTSYESSNRILQTAKYRCDSDAPFHRSYLNTLTLKRRIILQY